MITKRRRGEINPDWEDRVEIPNAATVAAIIEADAGKSEKVTEAELLKVLEIEEGNALLDKAAENPTLDAYLDRSPKVGQPIDYPAMVANLQRKRQMFITAETKRKSGIKEEELE